MYVHVKWLVYFFIAIIFGYINLAVEGLYHNPFALLKILFLAAVFIVTESFLTSCAIGVSLDRYLQQTDLKPLRINMTFAVGFGYSLGYFLADPEYSFSILQNI